MHFAFTEDQRLFQSGLRELLEARCTAERVREAWRGDGRVEGLWGQLAGMGIVGLTAPEAAGGMGLGEVDLVLLLEEAGRVALPDPLAETTAVGLPLLRELGGALAERWVPAVAEGRAVITAALGPQVRPTHAAHADLLLVADGDALHALEPDSYRAEAQPSVDGGRGLATVDWDPSAEPPVATGDEARVLIERAVDRGALAAAAQAIGVADRMIAMGADYAQQREQFGTPIGAFQAVKHLLADALVALEFARPVVYRAAHSVAHDSDDRSRDVSMAKVYACEAATGAAKAVLQVHGAIGYTEEHDLHLWMKRAWGLAADWGDVRWHLTRVREAVLA